MQELMNETKLSSVQIQKWFANKRKFENILVIRYRKGKNKNKTVKNIIIEIIYLILKIHYWNLELKHSWSFLNILKINDNI